MKRFLFSIGYASTADSMLVIMIGTAARLMNEPQTNASDVTRQLSWNTPATRPCSTAWIARL